MKYFVGFAFRQGGKEIRSSETGHLDHALSIFQGALSNNYHQIMLYVMEKNRVTALPASELQDIPAITEKSIDALLAKYREHPAYSQKLNTRR